MRFLILILLAGVGYCGDLSTWYPHETLVVHERYTVAFDVARRVPRWVCWQIEPSTSKVSRAKMSFKPDPAVERSVMESDYAKSGFDLGHMCPAADMSSDVESLLATFLTSNVAPQVPALNRGDWKELEAALHKEASASPVICICGPIWLTGRADLIGTAGVAVPDAFFKIAYGGTASVARAWVMPNKPGNRKPADYEVPVSAVERATGLSFH